MSSGWLDELAAGDEVEDVDRSVEALRPLIKRQNELLASIVGGQGTANLPENVIPTPHKYSSIPPGKDEARLAVPSGSTTIDFEEGIVEHESEGVILDDDDVVSISDMSRGLDEVTAALRSIFVLADVPVQVRIGGNTNTWHEIDSCNYYPIPSQEFTEVELYSESVPFAFELKASTRAEPLDVDGVTVHATREGEKAAGTHDSYTPMVWQPHGLTDRVGDFSYAKGGIHAISFARNTFIVDNDSGNGNEIDLRLMAKQLHTDDWREIAEATGIADGDHHIFDVSERYHAYRVDVRNATNGDTVSAWGQYAGGAP